MATWNELFLDDKYIEILPQPEVYKFIKMLEGVFLGETLSIWDFCCGAGRHTVLISQMGHNAYASDISENGIACTRQRIEENGLTANLKVADMTENPFSGRIFHGAFSWNALHHNTIENIEKAVANIYDSLCDGGMFMASLVSTKAGGYGRGRKIEENTFVSEEGYEAGVPHHYFDYAGIKELFDGWKIVGLVEHVSTYMETEENFHDVNPFPYTKWNIIARK